ncbi:MAG: hypothetical protein JSR33_11270 [Proteobacteria bacterium]|nr:hypothetical protein [Pseudomonadota bacterium]
MYEMNKVRLLSIAWKICRTLALKLVTIVEKVDADFFDIISKRDQKILLALLNDLVAKSEFFEDGSRIASTSSART